MAHLWMQLNGGPCKHGEDHRDDGPCHDLMRWMGIVPYLEWADSTTVKHHHRRQAQLDIMTRLGG